MNKPAPLKSPPGKKKARHSQRELSADGLYAAPALDKGIDILECLGAVDHEHGLTKAEIAQNLQRNLSEIFRMIVTLERRGWVDVDSAERYHLSLRLFELAHHHHKVRTLSEAALEPMQALSRRTWQSCHLSLAERGRIVVIAQTNAPGNINFGIRIGASIGLFDTASGQVQLAFRSEEMRQQLISEYTMLAGEESLTSNQWIEDVEKVQQQGYVCSPSQQVGGVTNIGFPVWGRHGQIEAALVVPYLEYLTGSRGPSLLEVRDLVAEAAREISLLRGFVPSAPDTSSSLKSSTNLVS